VIRSKAPETRLFYASEELYVPPATGYYARLNAVVGSWAQLAEPLRAGFSSEHDGRPVDHVVYLKAFVVGYLENIIWDTALAERIADSLSIRMFLGYGPTERTPDHSSISRARNRFSEEQLQAVLSKVVDLCFKQGLLGGGPVAADSTLNCANASLSSLKNVQTGLSVTEHLKQAREANEPAEVNNKAYVSGTDADARIAKKGSARRGMYYKTTHVTDFQDQIILAVHTGTADTHDPTAAIEPLERAKERLESQGKRLGVVVADAGYDDSTFHAAVEGMGGTPLTNYTDKPSNKSEEVQKDRFVFVAERDVYICPNGAELARSSTYRQKTDCGFSSKVVRYLSRLEDCAGCPLKGSCLSGKSKQRSINRREHEDARLRNMARCHTDDGRAALKKRKEISEPPFAHMKRHGGLAVVNCRTLGRVQVKTIVGAIVWNLQKLAKVTQVA